VSDRTFLSWPFFEDRHRALASGASAWLAGIEVAPDLEEDERAYAWVRSLGAGGWLRFTVPAPYGGAAESLDVRSLCLMRETLAYDDALADFSFAMQGLGAGPISLFGDESLKEAYLPKVAAGQAIPAFALSERDAGSDVAALATAARRDGDEYVLDGEKTWISNGGVADFYVVFARTSDAGAKGLSAFVVDANAEGFKMTERIETVSPHPLGTLQFRNCRIPASKRLGAEGEGFKIAMATLDVFRSTVGAAALGFARRAMDESVRHVRRRKLFGRPLADLQLTQAKIADMAVAIDAAALLVYRAAWTKDTGAARVTREAAMAKLFATEHAFKVVDDTVQLFGALGVRSGEIPERLYRDVRALRIYEGASEIQQIVIARSVLEGSA
jgi:acyl-CoA dehydrogenase